MQRKSVNQIALLSCAEDRPDRTTPTAVEDVPRLVRDLVDVVEGVVPLPVARSAGWTLASDLVAAEPCRPSINLLSTGLLSPVFRIRTEPRWPG